MPIITAEEAAQYLNIQADTAGFKEQVASACKRAEVFCRRVFDLQESITEYHDIYAGQCVIWVKHPPIVTLTSVTDDANTTIITSRSNRAITVTSNVELYPDGGPHLYLKLVNNESVFVPGSKTAKVVYTGGYAGEDMPGDLKQAVKMLVAYWWEGPEAFTRKQQAVDGQAITWAEPDSEAPDMPKPVANILRGYRLVVF